MLVETVELRATGMRLTPEEVAAAPRVVGNLTILKDGTALLHLGDDPNHAHLLRPLLRTSVGPMKGDSFMVSGEQQVSQWSGETHRQAWWCRALRGDHLPAPSPLKDRGSLS